MASGFSIHVGLNEVDPEHYAGWGGQLTACEADAGDMQELATTAGFQPKLMLTAEATSEAVIAALSEAADTLAAGDILFLTYSGHGGRVPDANSDEDDRFDETWCLYDRQLVDDELYTLWSRFQPGVRVFMLSDSCHSGTAARATRDLIGAEPIIAATGSGTTKSPPVLKGLPKDLADRVYEENREDYDQVQAETTAVDKTEIPPSVLLISGCQDSQTSADGDENGLFTATLLKVWDGGSFDGDYRMLGKRIVDAMPLWQVPNYFWARESDLKFERQRPLTI
jgi:metacaspase-1